jgi:hypothetical protein
MTNVEGTVTENISETIAPGLSVYDQDSNKIGHVGDIDRVAGWFTVERNEFSDKDLYIPFSLVTNIDPRDLFLAGTRDELRTSYTNPPARSTLVEEVHGKTTAITSEASGYDGSRVEVDTARIDKLKKHVAVGSYVYSSDSHELGKIKQLDPVSGVMTVEKGVFSKHDLLVPVAVVDYVDRNTGDVFLASSRGDVERMQRGDPAAVVEVEVRDREE